MKTQNTHNVTHSLKSFGLLALVVLITMGSAFAGAEDSLKTKNVSSTEEAAMIDELLTELEDERELKELLASSEATYKIYDINDTLLFSGNEAQWNSRKSDELISLKRKAEFLMEDEGNNIYKIF